MWQFEELGYDYSINHCENGTVSPDCRTSPKPIRWDYYQNANRRALYNVYSKLLTLRNVPNFVSTFTTGNVSSNLAGAFKSLQITSDSLKITVIGNFDVTATTGTVTFQEAGTWYNYLSGGTKAATGSTESVTLQPGEYYVYTNREVNSLVTALPLKLLSFQGRRNPNNISLSWSTSNEVNVREFIIERSFNNTDFSAIGTRPAGNSALHSSYSYFDIDNVAVKATNKLYYRLKMVDIDGKISYSTVSVISPASSANDISVYPNPVSANTVIEYRVAQAGKVVVSVLDITGKQIAVLHDGIRVAGVYKTGINNSGFSTKTLTNGTYFLRLQTNGKTMLQQFVVQH
jgi:hypothetical protein